MHCSNPCSNKFCKICKGIYSFHILGRDGVGHAGGDSPKLIKLASLASSTLSRTLLCLCPFEFLQLSQVQRQDQIGPEHVLSWSAVHPVAEWVGRFP